MAPLHKQFNPRYDRNRDIAALADYGLGYKKIAKQKGLNPSTVRNVVKRYKERGHVLDAPRTGRPTKITKKVQDTVDSITLENPQASLNQITELVSDMKIGRTTINKVTKKLGFKVVVPRKKPWFQKEQKKKRFEWCQRRKKWGREELRKIVRLDQARVEYTAYEPRKKVRIKAGEFHG